MAWGKKKSTAIPLTGRRAPEGYETSRFAYFLDNRLIDGIEVSLTHRPPALLPRTILGFHFCQRQSRSAAGRMGYNDRIGNRTSHLPACSTVSSWRQEEHAASRYWRDTELVQFPLQLRNASNYTEHNPEHRASCSKMCTRSLLHEKVKNRNKDSPFRVISRVTLPPQEWYHQITFKYHVALTTHLAIYFQLY
jgi:hypothetical protein